MLMGQWLVLFSSMFVLSQTSPMKPNPIRGVAFAKDGKVVFAAQENNVLFLQTNDAVILSKLKMDSPVVSTIAVSDDGKTIAVAHGKSGASGEIATYSLGGDNGLPKLLINLKAHNDLIQGFSFSPDGKLLASCSYDRLVKIWSVPEGRLVQELKDHSDSVYAVAFNKDGTMLASTGADRAIKVWDTKTWKKLHALGDSTDWVYTLAWSPVKNQLLGAGVDQTLRVWALEKDSSKLVVSAYAHTSGVTKAVWTSDGSKIVSIGEDKIWKIWNADKLSEIKAFKPLSDNPLALGLSPDGVTAAIARIDGKLDLFDLKTGDSVKPLVPFMEPKALLKSFTPTYAASGKKVTIAIKADHFEPPFVASSNMKGVVISPVASSPNGWLNLDVQIDATASPGICKINCKSSKDQMLEIDLEVDRFLRAAENEPNDSRLTGQALALPVSVKCSLQRPGDCDWFYIDALAGQEIAVQLQAEKDDKVFAPMLQMIAPDGTVVAESAQGWLAHVCSTKGRYGVEVRDRDYRGGQSLGSYRLHVGSFPIVTSVFPLGAQIGKESKWVLQGVGLSGKNVFKATIPNSFKEGDKVPFETLFPKLNVISGKTLVASDVLEKTFLQNELLPVPSVGNGLFADQKDVHVWKVEAKKGRKLIVETMASRLGSNVDTYLEILDPMGNPLPRVVLRGLSKTYTIFRDNDSVTSGIRIEAWNELAVNDYVIIGTDLMKIRALPRNPDDDCRFFQIDNKRLAFEGTTSIHHFLGQPIYKVSLNPPGTIFPPNGLPQITLFHQNDDGGPRQGKDSLLEFDPPADGIYTIRVREMQARFGPEASYRLLVRHPKPDYNLRLTPLNPSPGPGSGVPVNVEVDRFDGFDAAVEIKISGLPKGFHAPGFFIPRGENSASFSMFAEPDAKAPTIGHGKWAVKSSAQNSALKVEKELQFDAPKLGPKGILQTMVSPEVMTVKAGTEFKILVKIERSNGFSARVPLDVRGLPHGARVLDIGLNGILINPQETQRFVTIQVDSWLEPGTYPFVVLSKQEGKNTEFAAKSVVMNVVR